MEIGLTTNISTGQQNIGAGGRALVWKACRESRGRFFAALALLIALVAWVSSPAPNFLLATTRDSRISHWFTPSMFGAAGSLRASLPLGIGSLCPGPWWLRG
jgi:hypothetical protein